MNFKELDTPTLLIDKEVMMKNIKTMQEYADRNKVALRPHTKTHKMPYLAKIQEEYGCQGITVAKVGEAEVMAENGLKDIFIANEIVGEEKFKRIIELSKKVKISFGLDSIEQAKLIEETFAKYDATAVVLIEIEVGENRSGIIEEKDFIDLLTFLKDCPHIYLKGIFSHDGNSYNAPSTEEGEKRSTVSQVRTLHFADLAKEQGFKLETVSIGSTPSLMNQYPILEGVTELRPGTYILMDASQCHCVGDLSTAAATVLTTVISRPTEERVITDVGAKGITAQTRRVGVCATEGLGTIYEYPDVHITDVYDEHAIIYNKKFRDTVRVGDKVRIIPVHICPVVNLHENAYLIDKDGEVLEKIPVLCRGKLK